MAALLRLIAVVIAIEALFYVLLSLYIRSLRREKLEEEWDRRHPDRAGDSRERKDFVRRSMVGFEKTLKARLVGLVFVVPTLAIMAIIYYVNNR
ncbi:MAG: hypothetical protein Q4G14_02165 [Paracoccus sp. (in: a-proteobacteria)]|uniref:hypothetical protein n=1 Tax=Paracoccus sp. TaxID=267 RepID=UPI0026DFB8C2|nr:hypothetical protein [Paracoccus sp. (in: a-proteobacteria)]MDO5612031.1 hypothetical protein [Paracoccus sp. (in: a-proteobacteria)]MDO5630673.1 hypothetical protein [Paracoccus sp. (in: a-proteobacteria)]